jgi:positive regulator of sigma E activity
VEETPEVHTMAAQGDLLAAAAAILLIAGVAWFIYLYARKQKLRKREQNLKTYILKDPKMRDLYLQSRKESKQGSEK